MLLENNKKTQKIEYAFLVLILALAFYIAFIPKQHYPYPIHVDEWHLLSNMVAMQDAGSIFYADPYSGGSIGLFSSLEKGYLMFWGVFQDISGIPWLSIFRLFPAFIFMMLVLAVYMMARKHGFGLEAAFFTCFITTTLGILGPAFLVPVALGMLFIPVSFFITFNYRHIWSYVLIFVFMCFLLFIHPPSAASLALILGPYALISLKGEAKHGLCLILALGIPFLAPILILSNTLVDKIRQIFVYQELPWWIEFPNIPATYGYIPLVLGVLGSLILLIKADKPKYALVLGLLCIMLMCTTFYTFHYGDVIMYMRGLIYFMLLMGIVAGAGLMWIKNIRIPENLARRIKIPLKISQHFGKALALILVLVTLVFAIPNHQKIPYYHIIDDYDYEAFTWIRDNIGEKFEIALLDPWKATPFTAITQKRVYARIHSYPTDTSRAASEFLNSGSTNTTFLRDNGISIIYTQIPCNNPDLIEVRENVYLFKEPENSY